MNVFFIFGSRKGLLISSEHINDLYIILLTFDSSVRFGMAEFNLQKVVKKIEAILTESIG